MSYEQGIRDAVIALQRVFGHRLHPLSRKDIAGAAVEAFLSAQPKQWMCGGGHEQGWMCDSLNPPEMVEPQCGWVVRIVERETP